MSKTRPVLQQRVLSPAMQRLHALRLGAAGEARAIIFLQERGYQLLAQNVRYKQYEIDLVLFQPSTQHLVFCEVKTRQSSYFGDPSAAVSPAKLKALRVVIPHVLRQHNWHGEFRIDVVSVLPDSIQHFENVTW